MRINLSYFIPQGLWSFVITVIIKKNILPCHEGREDDTKLKWKDKPKDVSSFVFYLDS